MDTPELVKREARDLYRDWLAHQKFKPRNEQKQMMDFIVDVLTKDSQCIGIVEAGTGTGKTIAYCLAAYRVAKASQKTLVIVTSTVLLQNQLQTGELEQIAEVMKESPSFGIAKGRRRYVCLHRLKNLAENPAGSERDQSGVQTEEFETHAVATKLWDQFLNRQWSGDMDTLDFPLSRQQKEALTSDSLSCDWFTCERSGECPYPLARRRLKTLDIIVTNYSLLLASTQDDVNLLPEPEDCIYVFDEAHKLPDIVRNAEFWSASTEGIFSWIEGAENLVDRIVAEQPPRSQSPLNELHQQITKAASEARKTSAKLVELLEAVVQSPQDDIDVEEERPSRNFRFKSGQLRPFIVDCVTKLSEQLKHIGGSLQAVRKVILEGDAESVSLSNIQRQSKNIEETISLSRQGEGLQKLASSWGENHSSHAARWFIKPRSIFDGARDGFTLNSVSMAVDVSLNEKFWSKAHGVICTSATLATNRGFSFYSAMTGLQNLPAEQKLKLDSPFDTLNRVKFQIADIECLPNQKPGFFQESAPLLEKYLKPNKSGLVIFTSKEDMKDTHQCLSDKFRRFCFLQSDESPTVQIEKHKARIRAGKRSYLFGVDSFAEGLDLPGDLCQHVIVMRIGFPVPSTAEHKTLKEITGLSWTELDLQMAILKLKQTCGRLMRDETDKGSITVFDRRLKDKNYSDGIIRSLPPYKVVDLKKA